jgi:hypothetical protein
VKKVDKRGLIVFSKNKTKQKSIEHLTKSVDGTSLVGPPKMASAALGFPILCG